MNKIPVTEEYRQLRKADGLPREWFNYYVEPLLETMYDLDYSPAQVIALLTQDKLRRQR